jgi:uncharacterized membrane protein YhhN
VDNQTMKTSSEDQFRRLRTGALLGYASAFAVWQLADLLVPVAVRIAAVLRVVSLAGALVWTFAMRRMAAARRAIARDPSLQQAFQDELTVVHRARAYAIGFSSMLVAQVCIVIATFFLPIDGATAARISIVVGVATALVAFAIQERP